MPSLADRRVYLATPGHVKSFASPVVNEGTFTSEFVRGCFGEAPYRALPLRSHVARPGGRR